MRSPLRLGFTTSALVGLLMTWLTADLRASVLAPEITRFDVVSTSTATGDGGNAWGGHQPRIVRTRAGTFTAYSVSTGRGVLRRGWRLAQETPSGWRVIAGGKAGREPPALLAGPRGELYVIAWPSGWPRVW